jgi:hypothetical protein
MLPIVLTAINEKDTFYTLLFIDPPARKTSRMQTCPAIFPGSFTFQVVWNNAGKPVSLR